MQLRLTYKFEDKHLSGVGKVGPSLRIVDTCVYKCRMCNETIEKTHFNSSWLYFAFKPVLFQKQYSISSGRRIFKSKKEIKK